MPHVVVLVIAGFLAAPARAESPAPTDLLNKVLNLADDDGFRAAMPAISELLQQDNSDADSLRLSLQQHLAQTDEPRLVGRIALMLTSRPTRELIDSLAAKSTAGPMRMRTMALNQLATVLHRHPALDAGTTQVLLPQLEAIVRTADEQQILIDSALLAIGACRSAGFDVLVEIWNGKELGSDRKLNVFPTALSRTRDARALPILRNLATDPRTTEGTRIASVHGVGQLCMSLSSLGVEPAELAACQNMLRQILSETEDGQLFSVALRAAVKMEGMQKDPDVQQAIEEALYSQDNARREAALQALFQGDRDLALSLIEPIRGMATGASNDAGSSEVVRATAEAVVAWLDVEDPF